MKHHKKKVVVIGGGITGLTAAFYLNKIINENNLPMEVMLIESSHRLGGKIETEYRDGFIIEKGPDSFLERKISAKQLVLDVGLGDELVRNSTDKVHILAKNQLHPMPEGSVMGIPTKLLPLLKTKLFSIQGKCRATLDLILPRMKMNEDIAIGEFIRKRLGDEVAENLVEPLLSGIYIGDFDQLSLNSTFPQFKQTVEKHRSLIRGLPKMAKEGKADQLSLENHGRFLTLKNGLQSLVDRIENLLSSSIKILKGTTVIGIKRYEGNVYELKLNNNEVVIADSIICTVPHLSMAELFPNKEYISIYKQMPATTVATVVMAFDEERVKKDIVDGAGFVVSRHSDYTITACTLTSKKWPHTAPPGKVLLRCYVGRMGEETVVELSDAEIEKIVLDDLRTTMDIQTKPNFTIVTRWVHAFPQYTVGHKKRKEELNEKLFQEMPGIFVCGSSLEGPGLSDCIRQGKESVDRVIDFLGLSKGV